jgi:hypothetical protein
MKEKDIELRDPMVEGLSVIKDLNRKKCDFIVMLAHMKRTDLKTIIPQLEGIDLVIRGHAEKGEKVSSDCADTLGGIFEDLGVPVLFAGDKGRALGKAVMTPAEEGRYALTDTTLMMLGKAFEDDSVIVSLLEEFREEEIKRVKEIKISEFMARDPVTGKIGEKYLGIETCGRCHEQVATNFIMSRHFRAFARLTDGGEGRNPECLPCHSTGYGRFSGYDPEKEEESGRNLRGVQCEACHGAGTNHSRDGKYKVEARNSCKRCHTVERSPHFAFQTFWAIAGHRALADSSGSAEAHR